METPYVAAVDDRNSSDLRDAAVASKPPLEGDGLLKEDSNGGKASPPKKGSCAAMVCIVLVVLILAALLYALHRRSIWDSPIMWQSCSSFQSTAELPCSKRNQEDARCTYSYETLHVWCGGHYYFSENNHTGWIMMGTDRYMPAIWQDSHDCDELGMDGWYEACVENGMDENELEDDGGAACTLNQWDGFLSCGGMNFDYDADRVFTLTSYDDDRYWVPEDDA
ncbi:MAG: hypothetical protein SGILL_006297 [Bacillariaceae sp.]